LGCLHGYSPEFFDVALIGISGEFCFCIERLQYVRSVTELKSALAEVAYRNKYHSCRTIPIAYAKSVNWVRVVMNNRNDLDGPATVLENPIARMWAWLALDFAQRRQIVRISPIGAPLYRRADACHRPQVGER
jgi:hypothetical protein